MSKPRYLFYGYMKNIARAYPERKRSEEPRRPGEQRELEAVEHALKVTAAIPNTGEERIKLIRLTLFHGLDMETAACRCYLSYSRARTYQSEFLLVMARYMGLI